MSFSKLKKVFENMADNRVQAGTYPTELGTITADPPGLMLKPDSMKVELSYLNNEFVIADGVVLHKGDRVMIVPIANGQTYCVMTRVSQNHMQQVSGKSDGSHSIVQDMESGETHVKAPTGINLNNGTMGVARIGDSVQCPCGIGTIISGSSTVKAGD